MLFIDINWLQTISTHFNDQSINLLIMPVDFNTQSTLLSIFSNYRKHCINWYNSRLLDKKNHLCVS